MPHILILLFLALTAYAQMQERVAIIQTLDNSDSIHFNDLTYLTDKLRETAVNVLPKERYGVMTTESIVAFLGSQERAIKVCNESSCLAEVGRKVNADYVAQARIGRFDGDLTIKMELYSSKSGVMIGSFTGDSKSLQGLRNIIDEKAAILFKKLPDASEVASVPPPPPPPPPQEPQQVQYQPLLSAMEQRAKVQRLIDKGLAEGIKKEEIQKEASFLSYIDRKDLYDKNKKGFFSWSAVGYAALNTVPIFGSAIYATVDKKGLILLATDVVGSVILIYGVGIHNSRPREDLGVDHEYITYYLVGYSLLGISRITGLVVPFVHQNKLSKEYNKSLNEVLNGNNDISYSIDPLIIPKDGPPAVGLALNLRY